jgi:glutathione S-transferase
MLKLHFAPQSRAVRTLWLLEELGLDYELNHMAFHPKDLKSDEHRARHPLGRIPVLEDGDVMIFESGAIADYILERHKNGGLKPAPSDANFPTYLQWFHYCEGMVMPPINTIVVHTILLPEERRDEVVLGQAQRLLLKSLEGVEADMSDKDYLAGDFSAADTMLGHSVLMTERMGLLADNYPNLSAYTARLKARPALQRAFEIEQS